MLLRLLLLRMMLRLLLLFLSYCRYFVEVEASCCRRPFVGVEAVIMA